MPSKSFGLIRPTSSFGIQNACEIAHKGSLVVPKDEVICCRCLDELGPWHPSAPEEGSAFEGPS